MLGQASSSITYKGKYRHGLDSKKRITVPSAWCPEGETREFTTFVDMDGRYIAVMAPDEFEALLQKIKVDPRLNEIERDDILRDFTSSATDCSVDKQRRMVIPADFCTQIGLDEAVLLVGHSGKFEIWNPQSWDARHSASSARTKAYLKTLGL